MVIPAPHASSLLCPHAQTLLCLLPRGQQYTLCLRLSRSSMVVFRRLARSRGAASIVSPSMSGSWRKGRRKKAVVLFVVRLTWTTPAPPRDRLSTPPLSTAHPALCLGWVMRRPISGLHHLARTGEERTNTARRTPSESDHAHSRPPPVHHTHPQRHQAPRSLPPTPRNHVDGRLPRGGHFAG